MVIGLKHGVVVLVVVLSLSLRSSMAADPGRDHVVMSMFALFALDPGAVLRASLSMCGVVTPRDVGVGVRAWLVLLGIAVNSRWLLR